jgi:hypothetical protein
MEELKNLLEFAIDDSTISYDLDNRPIIDQDNLLGVLEDIISRREKALKYQIRMEIKEAVSKVLKEI